MSGWLDRRDGNKRIVEEIVGVIIVSIFWLFMFFLLFVICVW